MPLSLHTRQDKRLKRVETVSGFVVESKGREVLKYGKEDAKCTCTKKAEINSWDSTEGLEHGKETKHPKSNHHWYFVVIIDSTTG